MFCVSESSSFKGVVVGCSYYGCWLLVVGLAASSPEAIASWAVLFLSAALTGTAPVSPEKWCHLDCLVWF